VVVLVDTSRASRAALEEAAELAAHRGTELLGLFVEEEDLLRSAGLPFAGEIGPTSAALRPVDSRSMERRLRARAGELRRLLETLVRRHAIAGSLQVARGRVVAQALANAGPGDLVVVGKSGWSPLRTGRLGSTARDLLGQASLTVMVMEHPAAGAHPTVALFDHPEWGPRALDMAAQIARRDGRALAVLLPPGEPEAMAELRRGAEAWLTARGLQAEFHTLSAHSPRAVAAAVAAAEGRALVVSRQSPVLADGAQLVEAVAPPVVVVP
jgi:nucleotide-binding universal stress UspA family protein